MGVTEKNVIGNNPSIFYNKIMEPPCIVKGYQNL